MRWKFFAVPVLAMIFIGAALPARSQVTYSAEEAKLPFTIGFGVSNFLLDWGTKDPRATGVTLWADWRIPHMPPLINGLGLEFEGRDLNWAKPADLSTLRHDTALAGFIYESRRKTRIRPYGKYLMGIGSIDFPDSRNALYTHDTRTVYAPGGGLDVRFWNRFSVRGEYEYQFWHQIFGLNDLNPQGFTIGAVYDFGRRSTN